MDLVILIDSSGSIEQQNPSNGSWNNWQLMLRFASDLTKQFPTDSLRVSAVRFSRLATVIFPLSEPSQAIDRIENVRFEGSVTDTSAGLEKTINEVLNSRENRVNAYDVVIVLTDGAPQVNAQMVEPYANAIRTMGYSGAFLGAVGIGGTTTNDKSYYMQIGLVKDPNHLVFVRDFVNLRDTSILRSTTDMICNYLYQCISPSRCPGPFGPPPSGKVCLIRLTDCIIS